MNFYKAIHENILKGNYKNSLDKLNYVYKNDNKNLECIYLLSKVYYQLNDPYNSIFFLKKYNQIKPNNILILLNIAAILQNLGKISEAKEVYKNILKINPNVIKAYYGLFTLDNNDFDENALQKIHYLKLKKETLLSDKSLINFIISKIYKKNKDLKNEVEYLNLSHSQSFKSNINYNEQSNFYYEKIISNYFNKINFTGKNYTNENFNYSNIIFIVGLPRSGSTFIESILSQSSQKIKSLGEFHGINMCIFDQIAEKIYSSNFNLKDFKFEINKNLFQESLKNKFIFEDNQIIIDKSLENIFNIEIILQFFPNAKFIHTFRNYKDSVIAIHQSMLSELSWAHNISSIKKYINNYNNVIKFFKTRYPDKILDLDIERLTNSKELEAKKVFEFCNLVWDRKYLNYYDNKRLFSKTLSFNQIRSKIDKYDDNKYKKYYHLI
jgi:tetratricopeptide (TPR) repeat protein